LLQYLGLSAIYWRAK